MALPEIIKDIEARVKDTGDTMTGPLAMRNGVDIAFHPASNSHDSGDLIWYDGNDNETGRIWGFSDGTANIRFGASDSIKYLLHTGNYQNYALPLTGGSITGTLYIRNNANQIFLGTAGVSQIIFRNDSSNFYILTTDAGGTSWNSYRPLIINLATGVCSINGNAATATTLQTARNIQVNLASTSAASFNGSSNITPGVTGVLPIANGGTGKTTAAGAFHALASRGTTNGDLNTITNPGHGWIQLPSCTNTPYGNNPTGIFGFFEVQCPWENKATGVLQRFTRYETGDTFVRSYINNAWSNWFQISPSGKYLPLSGGTLTGTLKFSGSMGIQTRHIDGESTTFAGDLYLNYGVSAPIHVGKGGTYTISADGSYYSGKANTANSATTASTATTANTLGINATANLSNCLQYIQQSGQTSGNDLPQASWHHVLKMNHGTGDTYYKRLLAFDFWDAKAVKTAVATGNGATGTWYKFWLQGDSVTGAVWNDYAECREADTIEPGYVLVETGDDTLTKSIERLSPFAGVSSDTWGFSQGETDKAKTPIAVAGRVLVYPWQDRNNYKPGDCVCAAPDGKVDIMTREEVIQYPDRIVGTVSSVPTYDKWGGGEMADREPVDVNGRIWIKVR